MNKATKNHMNRVAEIGCIVCKIHLGVESPAELHHVRFKAGLGQRSDHKDVIPLCHPHHRTGGYGVAFHAGKKAFEANFGSEADLLDRVGTIINERA